MSTEASSSTPAQPAATPPGPEAVSVSMPPTVDPASRTDTSELTTDELLQLFPDQPSPNLNVEGTDGSSVSLSAPADEATLRPYATLPSVTDVAPPLVTSVTETPSDVVLDERPSGRQMFDSEIRFYGLEIKPEEIGPQAAAYQAAESLEAEATLLKRFITDDLLDKTWADIAELEQKITASRRISAKPGGEMLDRLRHARTLLLNARDKYEEAQQEVSTVRFRFTRIREIMFYEEPPWIFAWLVLAGALVVFGFMNMNLLSAVTQGNFAQATDPTGSSSAFWLSIFWGSAGGVTGAMFALWKHVASEKDYDPEFALWYYTNPVMGLILGAFAFLFANVGVVEFTSSYAVYIIAFALGFQQNLVFGILNGVIKRLLPAESKPPEEK